MPSPLAFSFDDSRVKMGVPKLLEDMGASSSIELYLMKRSPLDVSDDIGDISVEEDCRVLAMKKSGFGTKPFKKWLNEEVDYNGDSPAHPSTMYWQSQYKKWRLYDFFCDPKDLAAHDLVETLLMRLSFYLRNEKLLKTFRESDVYFGPFSPNDDGAYDLSYHSLAWYLGHLGDDRERQLERDWCAYAMAVANGEYLKEVAKLGYGKGQLLDATVFQEEIMIYVTKLRNLMNRNDIAHVFSTSVKQVWIRTDRYVKTKNRCLLDQPAVALEDGYKKKLVAILDDLAIDMPKGLDALVNIIPMQAYFLKSVLQKSVPNEVMPRPAKLPRTLPPPIH